MSCAPNELCGDCPDRGACQGATECLHGDRPLPDDRPESPEERFTWEFERCEMCEDAPEPCIHCWQRRAEDAERVIDNVLDRGLMRRVACDQDHGEYEGADQDCCEGAGWCYDFSAALSAARPSSPTPEEMREVERHLVWVCAGCDDCAPPDGSERSRGPCNGPSHNGAWVVLAEDYDRLAARAAAPSLEAIERLARWFHAESGNELGFDAMVEAGRGVYRHKAREALNATCSPTPGDDATTKEGR